MLQLLLVFQCSFLSWILDKSDMFWPELLQLNSLCVVCQSPQNMYKLYIWKTSHNKFGMEHVEVLGRW